jgi:hypothetical protein
MSLNGRIAKLEEEIDTEDLAPSLSERLHLALENAVSRRQQALDAPELPDDDNPLAERLRQAYARAAGLRTQAAGDPRAWPAAPTNGAG